MIVKQYVSHYAVNKALITEKIGKIKHISKDFLKILGQSFLKYNDPEPIISK